MRERRAGRSGFTIVELLTVIAIIAILAAITFPVMAVVRRNVRKGQCTTNLHQIAQAIKMYKDDWKVYPAALYGYVYQHPQLGVIEQTFLYPQYIKSKESFRCPLSPERAATSTTILPTVQPVTGEAWLYGYYAWDSYDGTRVPHPNGDYQLHYLRKWSPGAASFRDDPRQLIYRNPPDNTVITWCTYHRDYQGPQPAPGSIDLVLFLDGHVKPMPSDRLVATPQDPARPYHLVP